MNHQVVQLTSDARSSEGNPNPTPACGSPFVGLETGGVEQEVFQVTLVLHVSPLVIFGIDSEPCVP